MDHKGKWYQNQVQTKIRSLYSHAHRNVLLMLLDAFTFRSNSKEGNFILEAIKLIKNHRNDSVKYFLDTEIVPIKHVVPSEWHINVIETNGDGTKVNRINYEVAVLEELRRKLRCKSIWVDGAYRYSSPGEDLPKDFDEKRDHYFNLLNLPLSASDFI